MDTSTVLSRVDIFKGLSPEELNSIAQLSEHRKFNASDVIFTEKSKGQEMYILVKGQVCIELTIKGKADHATVHRVTDGEVFGELVIVGDGRRSGSARCETNCEVIALTRDDLLDLFDENTRMGYVVMKNIASLLAARLRKTNLQLIACFVWE